MWALLDSGTVTVATRAACTDVLTADEAGPVACACGFAVVGLMLFLPTAWRIAGLTGTGAEVCRECVDGCIAKLSKEQANAVNGR